MRGRQDQRVGRVKLLVVRGLCRADTMLRAPLHESCQVLANNLCRHLASPGFVLALDQDEFLAPSATIEPVPAISGALQRLAETAEAGTVTSSLLNGTRPRLQQRALGRGRCALFAGVS